MRWRGFVCSSPVTFVAFKKNLAIKSQCPRGCFIRASSVETSTWRPSCLLYFFWPVSCLKVSALIVLDQKDTPCSVSTLYRFVNFAPASYRIVSLHYLIPGVSCVLGLYCVDIVHYLFYGVVSGIVVSCCLMT